MSGLSLEAAREQRRAADAGASAWVSASAGSGKTKVLVDRLLNLLLAGAKPHRLLCLTYTKAAAAEMANRLSSMLSSWVTLPEADLAKNLEELLGHPPQADQLTRARRLFAQVLDAPGGLHIQTLHSFAQSLLARFPLEAGIAPHFTVMDERDQAQLLDEALQDVLNQARLGLDAPLALALEQVTARIHETRFADLMKELSSARARLARLLADRGGVLGVMKEVRAHLGLLDAGETLEAALLAACRETAFDALGLKAALSALLQGSKTDSARGDLMAVWMAASPKDRAVDFDAYAQAYLKQDMGPRQKMATKAAAEMLPGIDEILLTEQARLLAVYENLRAHKVALSTQALLTLADAVLDGYARLKERRGRLDYDDLIQAARRLIRQGTSWVLYKLDGGIDHVLIDEAQDTSPDQWDIVTSLCDEFFAGEGAGVQPRTVFAVGDVKQSIYSFQGADPSSFETMQDRLSRQVPEGGGRWEPVDLVVSFRSTRAVLEAVDAVFAEGEALAGVDLGRGYKRHLSHRAKAGGVVDLWPPLEPRALDEPEPWNPPVERLRGDAPSTRMARLLARRIQAMVGGERLESQNRPIEPGDILVLVQRRGGFMADLVRALKSLGVPVAGVDRLVVTDQLAVADLMALARFALLPEDDLTLACVLKGPFLGFDEERLFQACHQRKASLWAALAEKDKGAHVWLGDLLPLAARLAPHDFFAHLLGPLGGRKALLARLGQEALDAVDEFMTLALDYERSHAPSLTGFLSWLEAGKVEIKRDPEPGSGGFVRVMTVHGAKGLQAPVVFLPDTLSASKGRDFLVWTAKGAQGLPLWAPSVADRCQAVTNAAEETLQRRRHESHRLLYVAMTRAEDRLTIAGWQTAQTAPADAWYPMIKQGFLRVQAPEVDDPWLAQDADSPGSKLWRLSCPQEEGGQAKEKRAKGQRKSQLPDWALSPAPSEPLPLRPLIPSAPDDVEPLALSPLDPQTARRFERGRLIHRLLQTLPDLDRQERTSAASRYLAHAAAHWSEEARQALTGEVLRVLQDPSSSPLFGAGSKAEAPLVGLVDGRVLSGQVDRLAKVGDEIWVADFKTNRPVPADYSQIPGAYLRQMALYRAAARLLWPDLVVRTFLLWTDGPLLMEIRPS
ncbi:ATP-dependent exoDNAse beta subunit [Rhodospirillaceae bacterium LM-1]|nr:ATP-dependent exoDNAse beta subunit [Rhodospirillaceae bacterium LM-1]